MPTAFLYLGRVGSKAAAIQGNTDVIIGVPTEVKNAERRVGLTPTSVREVVAAGHSVIVQAGAGMGIDKSDDDYERAGAKIAPTAADVWTDADMVVKVKEPQAEERAMLRPGQVLFTYLHLAPDPDQALDLVASGATCIAYETVTDDQGRLPLLAPMSQVAGRMSIQAGAFALESAHGGSGKLLGGVPGVAPAQVVIIGGGVVGKHATEMAVGMGADVTVLDRDLDVLNSLDARFDARITTAVLHGRRARGAGARRRPRHRRRARQGRSGTEARDRVDGAPHACRFGAGRRRHRPGWLLRDLTGDHPRRADLHRRRRRALLRRQHARRRAADLGLRPQQRDPAVRAAPGAGPLDMLRLDPHLRNGLNVHAGMVTEAAVADALDYDYVEPLAALA
jgi:alanine dehydrogenase